MFERGWTIVRVRGIPVKLHVTLLLFLPYVAFVAAREFALLADRVNLPPNATLLPPLAWGLVLAVGLFASIVLHELGHALVATKSGVRVRSITLMMLGGVSRLETDVPPEREAWMAFAGPLVSLGIAAVAYLAYRFVPLPAGLDIALFLFAATNAMLAAFNLLPAFPMDGGRVLRGLLVKPLGRERATRVATYLGKASALAFALFGLLTVNLLLVLIAGFVYVGASAEQAQARASDVLHTFPVRELMTSRLGEAHPGESTSDVARRLLRQDLVGARVVGNGVARQEEEGDEERVATGNGHGRTLGVVTARDLLRLSARGGGQEPVEATMRSDLPVVHEGDDAGDALAPLLTGSVPAVVVVVDGGDEIVGLVTGAEIERAMAVGSLRAGPPGHG